MGMKIKKGSGLWGLVMLFEGEKVRHKNDCKGIFYYLENKNPVILCNEKGDTIPQILIHSMITDVDMNSGWEVVEDMEEVHDIIWAMKKLKKGGKIRRAIWDNKKNHYSLYIDLEWLTIFDIEATDWELYEDPEKECICLDCDRLFKSRNGLVYCNASLISGEDDFKYLGYEGYVKKLQPPDWCPK